MRENLGALSQKGREVIRKASLQSQRPCGVTKTEARAVTRLADKENSSEQCSKSLDQLSLCRKLQCCMHTHATLLLVERGGLSSGVKRRISHLVL